LRGTRPLFQPVPPILWTFLRRRLLIVDQLESRLSPNLAEHIVRQFNDSKVRTRSVLFILLHARRQPRKKENVERGYVQGRSIESQKTKVRSPLGIKDKDSFP